MSRVDAPGQTGVVNSVQVIVGAGPIGTSLALRLADAGHPVRVVTRSGRGPRHPAIEVRALDAADPEALGAATRDAAVLYNCANPGSYPSWERVWPPLAASILRAAEGAQAVLVTMGNLYGYGPVEQPMTRGMPLRPSDHKGALRARMWADALAAHDAGRVRATEARASDYLGPTAPVSSSILAMYAARTLAGKGAAVFSDPDQPHAWAAVDDIAATLERLGTDERAWGSPWLVPATATLSIREVLRDLGTEAGTGEPRLSVVPRGVLRAGGLVVPLLREVLGVIYQFDRPFRVDASDTTATFGVEATPWAELAPATATAWRDRAR